MCDIHHHIQSFINDRKTPVMIYLNILFPRKITPPPLHLVTQFSIHLFIYMVLNMNTHSMKIYTPWNNFTTIPELLTKEWWYVSLHHQFSDIMILIYIIQWLSNLSGMIFPWIKNIYNDNRFSMPKYFFHAEWPQIQRISIYRPPTKVFGSWYHMKNTLKLFGKLFLVSTQNTCGSYLWVFQLSVLTKWIFYWMNHIRVKGVTPKLFFQWYLLFNNILDLGMKVYIDKEANETGGTTMHINAIKFIEVITLIYFSYFCTSILWHQFSGLYKLGWTAHPILPGCNILHHPAGL